MKQLAGIMALLLLVSCGSEEARTRPDYVIPQDSMTALLVELQLLNALNQHRDVRRKKLTDFVKVEQRHLFDSLGLDQARIDSSMNYYLQDYNQFQKMHDDAMNMLSERMTQRKAQRAERREQLEISKQKQK